MKVERESDRDYRRWSVEVDPWVERAIAAAIIVLVTGSAGFLAGIPPFPGH